MHSQLPLTFKIGIICGLAWVIIWVSAHVYDNPVSISLLATLVEGIFVVLIARSWPWIVQRKWRVLPKWLQVDLSGTWTGTIVAVRPTNGGGSTTVEKPATAKIVQGWEHIRIDIHTDEMAGKSVNAVAIFKAPADLEIRYLYQTEPLNRASQNNPPQNLGCAKAHVDLDNPNTIKISYSSERGRGDIALQRTGLPPADGLSRLVRRLFRR